MEGVAAVTCINERGSMRNMVLFLGFFQGVLIFVFKWWLDLGWNSSQSSCQ